MTEIDSEREYLINDVLAKQAQWEEKEYFLEMERNKRLPAVIKVLIPDFKKNENKRNSTKRTKSTRV